MIPIPRDVLAGEASFRRGSRVVRRTELPENTRCNFRSASVITCVPARESAEIKCSSTYRYRRSGLAQFPKRANGRALLPAMQIRG